MNRAGLAWRPGIIAAIPVAAMMALGTILGQTVAAVTLGVGAMLVGVAWRAGDGPESPPLGTMAAAAGMLALSTLVGTLTGRWAWVHLGVLCLFCLWAGVSSAIGRRGAVVGTQTLIAFIVFGRFHESLLGGLRLAGLVLGGACAQLLFAALVGTPLAWRRQRRLLLDAYRQLADIAAELTGSAVPAAEAFDLAEGALAAPALFGDPHRAGLITLVAEGRRIRLELLALRSALPGRGDGSAEAETDALITGASAALARLAEGLALVVASLDGADPAVSERAVAELKRWGEHREPLGSPLLEARVAALGGQVRGALRHAAAVARDGAGGNWGLPHPSLGSRSSLAAPAADLQRIRDGLSLSSPPGRHAIRLTVVVAGTELLTQRAGLPRAYWAVVAAATVLRPNFGDTFTRGAERMLGTLVGAVLATLIAVAIDPAGWGIVATIGLLAALTYTAFGASFAAGVAGLTAMIVFLLHAVAPDSSTIALDRGLDTLIGGGIALGATLLWPTWSAESLPARLKVLTAAQRDYLLAVLGPHTGARLASTRGASTRLVSTRGAGARLASTRGAGTRHAGTGAGKRPLSGTAVLGPLARHVRVAYADAEATVAQAGGELGRGHGPLSPEDAAVALGALRRVTDAIHALRLILDPDHGERLGWRDGHLAPLVRALGETLERLTQPSVPAEAPELRALLGTVAPELEEGLGLALDELVDAVNTAAVALRGSDGGATARGATAQLGSFRAV